MGTGPVARYTEFLTLLWRFEPSASFKMKSRRLAPLRQDPLMESDIRFAAVGGLHATC